MSRVNGQALQRHVNRTVLLVGRVASYSGAHAVVEACDGGTVNVALIPGSHVDCEGCIVEVMGIVRGDLSVQEQVSTKFDEPTYNAAAYGRLIEVTEKYPDLF
ncbi:hypothetical protein BC830DRAFT_1157353 [Chytriomyces sp. MP71]|nr:hypothetical protein BC830DRAFT_1157353 [Chytriomyces sp. MP71]